MSLVQTLMGPLRSRYAGKMDKNEYRRSRYGAWDFFQDQTSSPVGILSDEDKSNVKKSFGNTMQIPVFDAEDVTISNVRSCVVAASENTTKLVAITFATYSFGFTMYPAQHFNNQINYQQDWDKKMEKYLLKLAATLDSAAIAKLNTDKNTYLPADILAYYPQVGNSLQVTQGQKNDFFNQADAILQTMDFYGQPHVVASTSLKPMINRLSAQGGGNAVNEDFQFNGYEWHFSNRVSNGAGIQSTGFLVQEGNVAVVNRNDPDAVMGSSTKSGKEWGEVTLPIVNLKVGSYHYDDCADLSALHSGTTGLTRSKMEGFEFSTDIAFVTAYNSNRAGKYNPIQKFEVSAS